VILCDAGPLIALIDRRDSQHLQCSRAFSALDEKLLSTWPCFSEAMHLLMRAGGIVAAESLWNLVEEGELFLFDLDSTDRGRIRQLMLKYNDLPMDLADGSLVVAAERRKVRTVFTLDKDFRIYRSANGDHFDVIP
jgi:predicted nucleic acid-binding protein